MKNMGSGFEREYIPNQEFVPTYDKLYDRYMTMGRHMEALTDEFTSIEEK